jgi:hypothetical protein
MAEKAKTRQLRYDGGASLTYRDGLGRRQTARHGIPFTVDEETAVALLETDPAVVELDKEGDVVADDTAEAEAAALEQQRYAGLNSKQLKAEAKSRKLSTVGTNEALVTRLLADDREKAAAASAAAPHPSSSEAETGVAPPPSGMEIREDSEGTDATGKTVGGPESGQVGTAADRGTTSASAPSGAVTLGDLPASAKVPPGR